MNTSGYCIPITSSCSYYKIHPFPVRKHIFHAYIAFLGRSLGSYASVNNYLAALKKVNILMGAEIDFMPDIESSMLKRSLRKILGENGNRKEEITIDILSRLCMVLDDSIPLQRVYESAVFGCIFLFSAQVQFATALAVGSCRRSGHVLTAPRCHFQGRQCSIAHLSHQNFVIQV